MRSEAFDELHGLAIEMSSECRLKVKHHAIAIYLSRMYMWRIDSRRGMITKGLYEKYQEFIFDAVVKLDDHEWELIRNAILGYRTVERRAWRSYIRGWIQDLETIRSFG